MNKNSGICFAMLFLLLSACTTDSNDGAITEASIASTDSETVSYPLAPLREQHESKYVTDRSRWGELVFDRQGMQDEPTFSEEFTQLADMIESYQSQWLDRNEDGIAELVDDDAVRFRQGRAAYGKDDVITMIRGESRGERPEGYKSSMQLTVRDVQLRIDEASFATALYRVDIRGGARWEYADLATILQVFRKTEDGWKIVAHVETLDLGDPSAPALPDEVPNRVSPIRFDFVYPVEDLERAVGFYAPLLGDPIVSTPDRASFQVGRSYFDLTTVPIDDRIVIKPGMANGYGIIDVESLESIGRRLSSSGTMDLRETPCERGQCIVAEDPSGNVIVWREAQVVQASTDAEPSVRFVDADPDPSIAREVQSVMQAWMSADTDRVLGMLANDVVWVDDAYDLAFSTAQIATVLEERWADLGAGAGGLDGELVIDNLRDQSVGSRNLVTFEASLVLRDRPKSSGRLLVTQVWTGDSGGPKLELMFLTRARISVDRPVNSMDYTAYPVTDLGMAGAWYKSVFESEPYRDENWFGFWSTSSVFGLVGDFPDRESYSPVPHRSNGYADLSIRSAEEVYEYLESRGATFPLVEGINGEPGIDSQPGYRQILAVDSEGNLINFSEYLEY